MFGAVVVFHDITEEVELEKVREEFTSMIVHELRSPLDGMRKIVELLAIGKVKAASKEFGEYIKLVYQSSTSMLELVNDILDFSKLQAGKFEIHKEEGSLKDVIENRTEFYKVSADTKKIKLSSFIDPSTPTLSKFDQSSVKQVLNNFISNSLKFTEVGGSIEVVSFLFEPEGTLASSVREKLDSLPIKFIEGLHLKEKSIVVAVIDNGLGISKDKIKDLFLKYKQASGSPIYSEDKGTGLGLVIAKGIVESHGGSIGVSSVEKQGSIFYFTLPLQ
jgi:signal transduction histidine kinase